MEPVRGDHDSVTQVVSVTLTRFPQACPPRLSDFLCFPEPPYLTGPERPSRGKATKRCSRLISAAPRKDVS